MSLLAVNSTIASGPAPIRAPGRLISFTVRPLPGERTTTLCRRLSGQLREQSATPLQLLGFGQCRASAATAEALRQACGQPDWPITWVEGVDCDGRAIAGLQVHAFTGEVERIRWGGRVVGSVFTDGGARQCVIGGLTPADLTLSRPAQTLRVLEDLQTILNNAGFDLADVVRTWFYLDRILKWYEDFNPARTRIYSGVKFRTGSLPASTGIGAKNPAGAALTLAAWALRPLRNDAYAEEVASPLQCPAPAYGSSFSRALETSTNAGRRLFISGTASIEPGGKTMWVGDVGKQVDLTMDVVEAILRSRRFTLNDLTRATAYFRRATDAGVFAAWLARKGLAQMPVVCARCDVCRDDLLFELEGEAMAGI